MLGICFKPIFLDRNVGLGNALCKAISQCTYSLVARMDSDDVAIENRFEMQLQQFQAHPEMDIIGGNITEFVGEESHIIGRRIVPEDDSRIKRFMKKRCPMNHVTVMYKRNSVMRAGGYIDWYCNEDYYLWIRMMEMGCSFHNLQKDLVNVRVGNEMSARRGGIQYFQSEKKIQKYMLEHGIIGLPQYVYNVLIRFLGEVIANNTLRGWLYKLTRGKYKVELKENVQENSQENMQEKGCDLKNIEHHYEYPPFSVAMCVYAKDNASWFDRALDSIIHQSVKPNEIVLVVDGPVSEEIQRVIDRYATLCEEGDVKCE